MPDNWDVFKDRTESLLARWDRFKKSHPDMDAAECIKACLAEITDDFTKGLIGDREVR